MLGTIATICTATIIINQFVDTHELSVMDLKIDRMDIKIEAIAREVQTNHLINKIEAQATKEKMAAIDGKLQILFKLKWWC